MEKNPEKIDFKSNTNSVSVTYFPTNIKEFRVKNDLYVSGIVEAENTSLSDINLEQNFRAKITVDTTFLQTLIKGNKSLYYYKNSDGRVNFYIKNNGKLELLVYIKYLTPHNNEYLVAEYNKYIFQLDSYLDGCETIQAKLKNTSYNKSKLIELFREYYKCSFSEPDFQKKMKKINIEIGLLTGISLTSLKFTSWSELFDYVVKTNYKTSRDFSAGLAINLVLPWSQSKFSIDNDFLFSTYKFRNTIENIRDKNIYTYITTELDYSYLKINNLVSYKYPIGNVFLFCKAGISNGFAVNETNYKKTESFVYSVSYTSEGPALKYTRKLETSLVFGTGIKYKKLSCEARYEKGNGMSDIINLTSSTSRYYFLLGYRFK